MGQPLLFCPMTKNTISTDKLLLQGYLFDLDGTLVDTSRDITANLNRAFVTFGYPELPHEVILSHVGFGARFLVEQCLKVNKSDVQVDDKLVTEFWESFRDHYRDHIIDHALPYTGVREFLKATQQPMGVISNKPEEFVKAVLVALDMDQHFKFMWGRDSLPVSKPDPEVIRYGVYELGVSEASSVCMVGDNPVDIIAAKGAGALAVGLSSGFSPVDHLEAEHPDYLFHSFEAFALTFRGVD